jgi:hypothetical protein
MRAQNADLLEQQQQKMTVNEAETGTRNGEIKAGSFHMRKRISSTTYEVAVYFNPESKETMDDKILRLVRGTTSNENDKQN